MIPIYLQNMSNNALLKNPSVDHSLQLKAHSWTKVIKTKIVLLYNSHIFSVASVCPPPTVYLQHTQMQYLQCTLGYQLGDMRDFFMSAKWTTHPEKYCHVCVILQKN